MNKYFLYVGTKLVGANDRAWGTREGAHAADLDVCEAPFDGRWVDAGNLALCKYLPNNGAGWELLLNTAGDHNPLADGTRSFARFKPDRTVTRGAKPLPASSDALAYGLVKDEGWAPVPLATTSIMQGDLITAAKNHGKLSPTIVFTDSQGNLPPTGNNSGHTTKEALDSLCAALQARLRLPAFTVTDSNTFHTSGYLWAKVALDAAIARGGAGPVLIVNFDQHQDYQAPARLVKSDGWGKAILRNYKGAFINFGCNGINTGLGSEGFLLATNTAPGDEPKTVRGVTGDGPKITMNHFVGLDTPTKKDYGAVGPDLQFLGVNIPATIAAIERALGDRFKYCFITVDRDCMLNNGTQWGMSEPAFWSAAHLRSVMEILLRHLGQREVELTGLDITGLPEALASANPLRQTVGEKVRNIPAMLTGDPLCAAVRQEIADFEALLAVYDRAHLGGNLYRIQAASVHADDSLKLDYSLKASGGQVTAGKLDGFGRAFFRTTRIEDWQLSFPGQERTSSSIRLGVNTALGSARYTYEVTRVYP